MNMIDLFSFSIDWEPQLNVQVFQLDFIEKDKPSTNFEIILVHNLPKKFVKTQISKNYLCDSFQFLEKKEIVRELDGGKNINYAEKTELDLNFQAVEPHSEKGPLWIQTEPFELQKECQYEYKHPAWISISKFELQWSLPKNVHFLSHNLVIVKSAFRRLTGKQCLNERKRLDCCARP